MTARQWLTAALMLSAPFAATGAEAAMKGPRPVAVGCSHPIPPFCMGVTTPQRTTYSLFNANPFIPPGTAIAVWGTVSGISPCGTSISVSKWVPLKGKAAQRLACVR